MRVAIAYAVAAWLIMQLADVLGSLLDLPDWIGRFIVLLLAIGFMVSLILAWVYEMTPEGVKLEKDVERSPSITHTTGRKLDFVIIGVLSVAVVFFALDKFVWSAGGRVDLDKSIAVLPFENRSADASDAYFVDGIHDDILTQLHKLSGIDKVISRTSMERYRNTEMTMPEIAAELGVATILEGSVQRAGNRVRITMQLISAADDRHLWAENYDRELTTGNVFEIQSEIAGAVAGALQATLTAGEATQLASLPTDSLEAYDAYLLGKHAMRSRDLDDFARARRYFEDAIALDPEFALAWVGLADSINLSAQYGAAASPGEFSAMLAEAEGAAMRALEINDQLGEAYATLGYVQIGPGVGQLSRDFDVDSAHANFERAIALSPNYADTYRWYSQLYSNGGVGIAPSENGPSLAERAVEPDPMSAPNHAMLAQAYSANGRYADATRSLTRALEIDPEYEPAIRILVGLHRINGHYAKAIAAGRSYRWSNTTFDGQKSLTYMHIALSYSSLSGNSAEFRHWAVLTQAVGPLPGADIVQYVLNFYAGRQEENVARSREILARFPMCDTCVEDIAFNHVHKGESEALLRLVDAGLEVARRAPRQARDPFGSAIADVLMHLALGNRQFALEALNDAVDDGWRSLAYRDNPLFDSISDDPEFVAVADRVIDDLDAKVGWLREQEESGAVPPARRYRTNLIQHVRATRLS